jgi:hypothetical protein
MEAAPLPGAHFGHTAAAFSSRPVGTPTGAIMRRAQKKRGACAPLSLAAPGPV